MQLRLLPEKKATNLRLLPSKKEIPLGVADTELWAETEEKPYRPPLSPEEKARADVELIYRKQGEQLPIKLRLLHGIERAKPIVEAALLPHWAFLKALRGITGAVEPKTTVWRTLLSSAKKGILESEKVEPISVQAMKAYPKMPWQTAGFIGTITEFEALTLGAGTRFISELHRAKTTADLEPIVDRIYTNRMKQLVKEGKATPEMVINPEFQATGKNFVRQWLKTLKGANKEFLDDMVKVNKALTQKYAYRVYAGVPGKARTLTGEILKRGGLDPRKLAKDYNIKEFTEFGLGHILKKGGGELDNIASQLQSEGLITVPEDMNPGDYLVEQLKTKEARRITEKPEKAIQREYEEFLKAKPEDKVFEWEPEKYEAEIQAELVKETNAIMKQAGKPSVLKTSDVKRIIREQTGQRKVSNIIEITEGEALREQLRKESFTAKKGFIAGRKVGIEKQKAHNLEIAMRVEARNEARTKVNSLIDDIKSIDTSKMRPEFAKSIQEKIDNLNFAKPAKKTEYTLNSMIDELQRNPETDIPDYELEKIKRLYKKNIRDYTVDELESLHKSVMSYAKQNKLKNKIIVEKKEKLIKDVIDDSRKRMKPRKEIDSKNITEVEKTSLQKFGDKFVETFGVRHEHPDLVIETIAGGTDNDLYRVMFNDVNNGYIKNLDYVHDSEDMYTNGLDGVNFNRHDIKDVNKWLREKVTFDLTNGKKITISRGKKLSFLKHFANDKNISAILEGGFVFKDEPTLVYDITPDDFDIIVKSVTEAESDFLNPSNPLFKNQYNLLNEVHINTKGYTLPKEDNYFPLERALAGKKLLEEKDIIEQFKNQYVRIGLWKGMLKGRVKSKLPVIIRDIDEVIANSVFNAGAYIGLEESLSNVSKILYNPVFRNEIENRYGKATWNYLDKAMRDLAREHNSYTSVEEMLLRFKNPVTSAILGLNPFVMAKQTASFFLYNVYVDSNSLLRGIVKYRTHRSKILERHMKYSPLFRERMKTGYARDIADVLKKGAERRFTGEKKTIQQQMMGGIRLFDKETVAQGMEGCIIQKLEELETQTDLSSEEKLIEAYKWADEVTSKTQPMFNPQFRSDISRGTATEKLLTWFSTQLNQNLNLLRRTWRETRRTGDYNRFAHALVHIIITNGTIIYMIDRARDKLYKKAKEASLGEWLLAIATNSASMFYFARDAAQSFQNKIKRGTFLGRDITNPIGSVLDAFVDTAVYGTQIFTETDAEKRKKAAKKFIEGTKRLIFTAYGLPYYTPRKIIRTLMGFEEEQRKKKGDLRLFR